MAQPIQVSHSVSLQSKAIAKLRLPHPFLTEFVVVPCQSVTEENGTLLELRPSKQGQGAALPSDFNDIQILFTSPKTSEDCHIPLSDNSQWARSQRAHHSVFWWNLNTSPSAAQVWLIVYAIFILQPDLEIFRVSLTGTNPENLENELIASALAYEHPQPTTQDSIASNKDIVISRSAFWQGAASPFGHRSPWTPSSRLTINVEPSDFTITTMVSGPRRVHQRHPRRPRKPEPRSIVYSRYIPSLNEHFSLVALDCQNETHVNLFHKWQNDPRVAQGWNETGTLEEHKNYLQKQHKDPHTLPVLGRFNDNYFSYFELYWAKEDTVGAYYDAGDFDRGRLALVGDSRYRGRHRVLAWWPCIIHYLFLDDHRTNNVVGELVATNNQVLIYDYMHGLHLEKWIDFPRKKAALVKVSRERFFQTCPFNQTGGFVAGTGLPLPARL